MACSFLTTVGVATLLPLLAGARPFLDPEAPAAEVCGTVLDRVDCSGGADNLTEALCRARGCCWDLGKPSCFYPVEGEAIGTVHVINSNHFDAGYADTTAAVLNKYFDVYFPRAVKVGAALRASKNVSMPLKWMTFSYIVSLFLDCPPGYGLHCPSQEALDNFTAAVKAQDIVWPAFPTNAELAAADPASLRFGVYLCNATSERFGMRPASVISTRDVPGMPRSAIATLRAAGVRALTEGMNGRMVPVNVPPLFNWRDDASGEEMLTMWHYGGYGSIGDVGGPIRTPGSSHALVYNWRGDNAGPPMSVEEVQQDLSAVQKQFPGAKVVTSTFDEYVDAILEAPDAISRLPTVTKDLADTWVWGMGSDPVKVARTRAIHRARTACEAAGRCAMSEDRYFNFSRQTQKNIEHTWGVSVFHYGNEANVHWDNVAFHELQASSEIFTYMEKSWLEQRRYGIDYPLQALEPSRDHPSAHPLAAAIQTEFAATEAHPLPDPTPAAYAPLAASALGDIRLGDVVLGIDPSTGAVTRLSPSSDGGFLTFASPTNPLVLLRYQTLVENDFAAWQAEYLRPGSGGQNEFGKPASFMHAAPRPTHQLATPTLASAWRSKTGSEVLLQLEFDETLHVVYGAPSSAWVSLKTTTTTTAAPHPTLDVAVTLVNKTSTRLPEAMYVTFNPVDSGAATATWRMSKLDGWVDPRDVADGASKGMHAVASGVAFTPPGGSMGGASSLFFGTPDTALVRWDAPLPFPTPLHRQPDLSLGMHAVLFDNIW